MLVHNTNGSEASRNAAEVCVEGCMERMEVSSKLLVSLEAVGKSATALFMNTSLPGYDRANKSAIVAQIIVLEGGSSASSPKPRTPGFASSSSEKAGHSASHVLLYGMPREEGGSSCVLVFFHPQKVGVSGPRSYQRRYRILNCKGL